MRQKRHQGSIGSTLNRRGGQANFNRITMQADDTIPCGPGLKVNAE